MDGVHSATPGTSTRSGSCSGAERPQLFSPCFISYGASGAAGHNFLKGSREKSNYYRANVRLRRCLRASPLRRWPRQSDQAQSGHTPSQQTTSIAADLSGSCEWRVGCKRRAATSQVVRIMKNRTPRQDVCGCEGPVLWELTTEIQETPLSEAKARHGVAARQAR